MEEIVIYKIESNKYASMGDAAEDSISQDRQHLLLWKICGYNILFQHQHLSLIRVTSQKDSTAPKNRKIWLLKILFLQAKVTFKLTGINKAICIFEPYWKR